MFRFAICCLLALLPLRATTILSVGGNTSAYFNLGPSQALASSFSTTSSYNGVSFFATLFDNTAVSASGVAYLARAIGAGATPATLVDREPFTIGPGATNLELFTEPVLVPGNYYLVLTGSATPGDFGWLITPFPALVAGPGVTEGQRLYADPSFNAATAFNAAYPPGSIFVSLDAPSNRMLLSVIATDVPEPWMGWPAGLLLAIIIRPVWGRFSTCSGFQPASETG